MRRRFQIMLLLVAFVPFALGLMTLVQGAGRLLPQDQISAAVDGQVRFCGVRSMLPFMLSVWIVANLERAFAVLVIVIGATAAGAVARLVAVMIHGADGPMVSVIIAFEFAALLFIPWYRRVVQSGGVARKEP